MYGCDVSVKPVAKRCGASPGGASLGCDAGQLSSRSDGEEGRGCLSGRERGGETLGEREGGGHRGRERARERDPASSC